MTTSNRVLPLSFIHCRQNYFIYLLFGFFGSIAVHYINSILGATVNTYNVRKLGAVRFEPEAAGQKEF